MTGKQYWGRTVTK